MAVPAGIVLNYCPAGESLSCTRHPIYAENNRTACYLWVVILYFLGSINNFVGLNADNVRHN